MSTTTENLELYEKTSTDWATDKFNIQTMLNDNFDKIDAWAGDVADDIDSIETDAAKKTVMIYGRYTGTGTQATASSPIVLTARVGFTVEAIYFCINSENIYYKYSSDSNQNGIPHMVTKTMTEPLNCGRQPKFTFSANTVSWYLTEAYSGSTQSIINGAIGMSNNLSGTVYHYILFGREG